MKIQKIYIMKASDFFQNEMKINDETKGRGISYSFSDG